MTSSLKVRLKSQALKALKAAGVYSLVRDSRWRHERLLILCYHGISIEDEHEWNPGLYMSLPQFESRLDMLRDGGYAVVPLGDALQALSRGELPARAVSITFDDGMHDFAVRAFPALEARQVPVSVYLVTYYSEYNRGVYTLICSYLLWKGRDRSLSLDTVIGEGGAFDLRHEASRHAAWSRLMEVCERDGYTLQDKDTVIHRLAAALEFDPSPLFARRLLHVMEPSEVEALARRGVDFQLHTHGHVTPLDRELFQEQIRENRMRIERLTNGPAIHFCYPSGVHRPQFLPWLEEERVVSATTCDPGIATRRTFPLLLPRFVDTCAVSPLVFEGWLTGTASWLPRKRSYADA